MVRSPESSGCAVLCCAVGSTGHAPHEAYEQKLQTGLNACAGNPLFGWWEMGSAIVGDEELHGHRAANEPDLSSATRRSDEDNTMMQDVVPFALLVHR